ncbi:MAG: TusE/DsrC/DsvC family sulfur relay protein [Gemmatimonadota bacterium]|jgi:tRNA 2-thiouridine synthesizing protein E
MQEKTYGGATLTVDADGFLTDPGQWTREIAEDLAAEAGITLTDRHWVVLDFVRKDSEDQGEPPGVRRITKLTDVSMKEMYQLFPKGPGILASKLAGYGKPQGCV